MYTDALRIFRTLGWQVGFGHDREKEQGDSEDIRTFSKASGIKNQDRL
jgi:hypothetical protein